MLEDRGNRKLVLRQISIMLIVVIGMFGFGYALVPLYNVLCKSLGINGKVTEQANLESAIVDKSRLLTIQFITQDRANLNGSFFPLEKTVTVNPGEQKRVAFYVENPSDRRVVLQAIPSVSPGIAAKYLKKTECFCFIQQKLEPHEGRDMPMIFHFDSELPKHIQNIVISYTIYDITDRVQ